MARLDSATISRRTVEALPVGDREAVYWDRELQGFGVRVYPSGSKVYLVQTRANGKSRRVTVGRHGLISAEQARRKAAQIIADIKAGNAPVLGNGASRMDAGPTLTEVAERYMREHVTVRCKPATARQCRHVLDRHLLPALGALALGEIGREQVAALQYGLHKTPSMANKVVDMLSRLFEGGEGVAGAEALKGLFESESLFHRVCPESPGTDDGSHVPWRGLREMLRFGGREPRLMWVFEEYPVAAEMLMKLDELEAEPANDGVSQITEAHKRREDLHAKWIEQKREFPDEDKRAYHEALETVVDHRHLANHVRLVNHARLHRLAMAVLARLADYAGLWERDLYFATLAIIRLRGATPAEVFAPDKLGLLRNGQIVRALRDNKEGGQSDSAHKAAIKKELKRLFGKDFLSDKIGEAGIRNSLAHFNMLRRKGKEPFNLTATVNDARRLMAYDRKLKNAVSLSVIELLARENLELAWTMNGAHELGDAQLKSRRAVHLGDDEITEDLHGPKFVAMAAELFGGAARPSTDTAPAGKAGTERGPHAGSAQSPSRSSPLPAPLLYAHIFHSFSLARFFGV